jgi:nucleoside-diphosphate-sugar epimerase
MLALVTGGQGFIGSHLCARLLQDGHRVRVLARPESDLSSLAGLDLTVVHGDLTRDQGLGEALAGVDRVFHLAGALKAFTPEALLVVNRDGSRRLAQACREHAPDLQRFVLVSSLAAAGPSPGGAALTEDAEPRPLTWYGASKLAAEREILASGLPATILRPPVVFGPRDRDVLSYFRIAQRGWLPLPGRAERRYSLIFAPDLADGIATAGLADLPSGCLLNLTGPAVTWADLGRRILVALGRRGRVLRLPEAAIRLAGNGADWLARLRGRPEIFSSQKVIEMLAAAWVASPDKAERLLGWSAPTPLDQALALTVRWYRYHGWL